MWSIKNHLDKTVFFREQLLATELICQTTWARLAVNGYEGICCNIMCNSETGDNPSVFWWLSNDLAQAIGQHEFKYLYFEEVLDLLPEHIRQNFLFHLDLFLNHTVAPWRKR